MNNQKEKKKKKKKGHKLSQPKPILHHKIICKNVQLKIKREIFIDICQKNC
jgi:hypothetical protein